MTAKIGVFSSGLWRLRARVAALTGLDPVFRRFSARGLTAVAGWGHKPTARRARACARAAGLPYLAIEDGFFRSIAPGETESSVSHVCDAEGVYYDARGPSAFERLVAARAVDPAAAMTAAAPALDAMRRLKLSKYNLFRAGPGALAALERARGGVALVVDQTVGDAAVEGAGADAATFRAMLVAAAEENPAATIVLRTHPETRAGRRPGFFSPAAIAAAAAAGPALAAARAEGRLIALDAAVAPMDLFARVARVYVVSSQMGFEALIAGLPVVCFGRAFYAGWGLTDDRAPPTGRRGPAPLAALAAAAFVDYARYFDPETGAPCAMIHALGRLAELRDRQAASPPAV